MKGRGSREPEILSIQNQAKHSQIDLRLPGGRKQDGDAHSVDTLIRTVYAETGLRIKPHQVRRIKLPNKGKTDEKSYRLRFYLMRITAEQFLDRDDVHPDSELIFIPVSRAVSMQKHFEPHGELVLLSGLVRNV